ncbi:narJ [Rhodococcus opacus M213]|uniref:NarJ n=1 Tax=Rhodococcus opacus M213 TaxID=1129896 RepID=K8XP51_RHOOP|nr:narJ [Rhodococcus opacus M213]
MVWQASSLLLAYPDDGHTRRLDTVEQLLALMASGARDTLDATYRFLRDTDPHTAAEVYVDTFDLRRRTTLYLTYWTSGDTRNRGNDILRFAHTYRSAGVQPPGDESPDHLAVLLEFAATVDPAAGMELMRLHRVPIGLLHEALTAARSPYGHVLDAVCDTLPMPTGHDEKRARDLALAGPPVEAVGLQTFTLTVPPRREGAG